MRWSRKQFGIEMAELKLDRCMNDRQVKAVVWIWNSSVTDWQMHEWQTVFAFKKYWRNYEFSYSYNLLGSLHEKNNFKKKRRSKCDGVTGSSLELKTKKTGKMHEWQTGQGSSLDLKQFSYGLADAWVTAVFAFKKYWRNYEFSYSYNLLGSLHETI